MTLNREEARSRLAGFYNIHDPSEQEVSAFILFGDNAPFLVEKKRARVAEKNISGGHAMKGKTIEEVLVELRGARQLLTMFCNDVVRIEANTYGNPQEALFSIEKSFEDGIRDLEEVIYKK